MRILLCLAFALSLTARAETLTVFAASSLTRAFTELAEEFEAEYPDTDILLNFAGSSTLATQLEQGAPADLFASADLANLLRVVTEGDTVPFATNRMVVIAPEESPVETLQDLATKDYLLVLAGESVPAGRYANEVLENLNALYGADYAEQVRSHLVSLETNVRQVAAKVALGEADAALVYATDAATLEGIRVLEIPQPYNVTALYPLAVVPESKHPELAETFIDFVLGEGQEVLRDYGFSSPP